MPTNPYNIDYGALSQLLSGVQRPGVRRPTRGPGLFPGTEATIDPSMELDSLQRQRKGELEDRMRRAIGGGASDDEQEMLKFDYQTVNRDIAASPLRAQEKEIADLESRGKEAILAGFANVGDPGYIGAGGYGEPIRRQAEYARAQEQRKLEQPERMAAAESASAMEREQETTRRATAVERMRGESALALQDKYNEFSRMMTPQAGGSNVRSFNPRTGAVSFGAPDQNDPAASLLNRLTNAKRDFEASKSMSTDQRTAREAEYNQALGNVISGFGADPNLQSFLGQVSNDPELSALSLQELLQHPDIDASELTEAELNLLNRIWPIIAGVR